MRVLTCAAIAALTCTAAPALAQDAEQAFSGPYVGGSVGYGFQNNDVGEFQRFDRGFDGTFDTITTTTGANAFSPGFCNGRAGGATPLPAGCRNDKDGWSYYGRIGMDSQSGNIVIGALGEFGKTEINDSVSAFSTTPANYVMTRDVKWEASIRGRIGYAPGTTLFYGTFGPGYANIDRSFTSTNTSSSPRTIRCLAPVCCSCFSPDSNSRFKMSLPS